MSPGCSSEYINRGGRCCRYLVRQGTHKRFLHFLNPETVYIIRLPVQMTPRRVRDWERRPTRAYTPTDTAEVIRICSSADPSAALIASISVYCSGPGFISKMYDHMGEPEATRLINASIMQLGPYSVFTNSIQTLTIIITLELQLHSVLAPKCNLASLCDYTSLGVFTLTDTWHWLSAWHFLVVTL